MSTSATSEQIKVRLYYWNARGRVQAIRYMLEDIAAKYPNVEYQDQFELFEKAAEVWPAQKADSSVSGPFGNLPVLYWNDTDLICQTLPITTFLARKFDLYGKPRTAEEDRDVFTALIDGVVSAAYTDIVFNVFMILWNQVDFDDSTNPYARLVKKVAADLKMLNNLLAKSSTSFFYDQTEPTIADYFVFYGYSLAKDFHAALIPAEEDSKALLKLDQIMRSRPALAKYFEEGRQCSRFSGSPTEEQYRAKLASKTN